MVPAALPALCPVGDEALAPAQTGQRGQNSRSPQAAPAQTLFAAGPSDVRALISWHKNRRRVNANVVNTNNWRSD